MANQFYPWQKFLSRFKLWKSDKIPVVVDENPSLGYEKKSRFYFLMILLIWLLAFWVAIKKKILGPNLKINTFWFDGICSVCKKVKETATTWEALDNIYNYQFKKDNTLKTKINDFWERELLNTKAVRNRLKLVKKLLRENIEKISVENEEIRLTSIASGSAQAVIEVMAEFKQKDISIKAIFLDLDPNAINHSKKLAQEAGIIDRIIFINKGVNVLEEALKGFNPHIIEVIGFLEYRPDEKAIKLIKKIYNLLVPGGTLLVSNINHNLEKPFLFWVVNWPMIYRKPAELAKIISLGGFSLGNCTFYTEPLKIHYIAECKKL